MFRLAGWRVNGLKTLRGLGSVKRSEPRKNQNDPRYVVTEAKARVVYRDDVRCSLDEPKCKTGKDIKAKA